MLYIVKAHFLGSSVMEAQVSEGAVVKAHVSEGALVEHKFLKVL